MIYISSSPDLDSRKGLQAVERLVLDTAEFLQGKLRLGVERLVFDTADFLHAKLRLAVERLVLDTAEVLQAWKVCFHSTSVVLVYS